MVPFQLVRREPCNALHRVEPFTGFQLRHWGNGWRYWLYLVGFQRTHEFDLQLGFGLFDEFDFSSAFVYSTEAEGTFIELVASSDIVREKFILTPYILLGINRGYIPEEPETFNNLQFGLTATTSLSQEMEASFHLAATTGLENIFWTGVSVSFGSFPHALPQDPTRRQH